MLGVQVIERNETRHRPCPREAYNLGGMTNIFMTKQGGICSILMVQTVDSIGIQKRSLSSRAEVMRETFTEGLGLERCLNKGQYLGNRKDLENK